MDPFAVVDEMTVDDCARHAAFSNSAAARAIASA